MSVPIVVDWLGQFGVGKCYVRNRQGKFDLDCFTLLRSVMWSRQKTSCSQKAKRFFDLEMSSEWRTDRLETHLPLKLVWYIQLMHSHNVHIQMISETMAI